MFLSGLDLYDFANGRAALVVSSKSLQAVEALARENGGGLQTRTVRVSPDGRYVAVALGFAVGIFDRTGHTVRVVPGIFRGWAGNEFVLTVIVAGVRPQGVPSLAVWPLRDTGQRSVVETSFKVPTVSSPDGDWFAYADPERRDVVFRLEDGTLLARNEVGFSPAVVAASSPAGPISTSPWP